MLDFRSHLIDARRILTRPQRRLQLRRLANVGKAPIMVPFYHRVANDRLSPWTLSCESFAQHVAFARANFELIALDEVQRRVRKQDSHRPAVSFTFDDGYADNSRFALPLLIRYQVPCTYFVALDQVLTGRSFPHDDAHGHPFAPNTIEHLKVAAAGGIEIGLHTRTHLDCAKVTDPQILEDEIVAAARELSEAVERRVRYFAFPFGMPEQLTRAAISAVQRAGLKGFCSAFGGYNLPGRDAFHIRRFHGDEEFARFRNWLEFDARKLRKEPRIEYPLDGFEPSTAFAKPEPAALAVGLDATVKPAEYAT